MLKDARNKTAANNIIAMFSLKGISILIQFALVPLTIDYLDVDRYGIWLTILSIVGWFTFFDIGLGNGLRNSLVKGIAENDTRLAKTYVSTTYAIVSIIFSVLFLVFLAVNFIVPWDKVLNVPASMRSELSQTVFITFLFFCLHFVLKLISTVVKSFQKPKLASMFEVLGSLLALIFIYVLTQAPGEKSLVKLAAAYACAPVIVYLAVSFILFSKKYKAVAPGIRYVDFRYSKGLLSLGVKFFLIQISAILLYQSNNIIITQVMGAGYVAQYNISHKLFGILNMGFSIILTPYWSLFTDAWVKKDIQWIKHTIRKLNYLWLTIFFASLLLLAVSPFIFSVWVGGKVDIPFALSAVMAVYFVVNCGTAIYSFFLSGTGHLKILTRYTVVSSVIHIPVGYFLCKAYGPAGPVVSIIIIGLIQLLFTVREYRKIIHDAERT